MPKKIRLVLVGKVREPYLKSGILEYSKRLSRFCSLEILNLKDRGVEREGEEIIEMLDANSYVLDEKGRGMDSLEFARLLLGREKISFFIGGPDGVSDSVRKKARLVSLSKMTFTHEMCALFLLEQVYRGFMIMGNKKYHR
ncbi:MAG: 23S rRNA (pseudouridine(1915)-N(3))-methyltransferase RlmH [Candidatus Micrarchaeota archaeon]